MSSATSEWKEVTSPEFIASSELSDIFSRHFDGNKVHLPGNSNEIMPVNTVPGLMVVSLAARATLQIPDYKEILCARDLKHIKFKLPVLRNQKLKVKIRYRDQAHKSRAGVIYRENHCEIICADSNTLHIHYEISQLLRERS